jgi:hypothetical protein
MSLPLTEKEEAYEVTRKLLTQAAALAQIVPQNVPFKMIQTNPWGRVPLGDELTVTDREKWAKFQER